MASQVGMVGLGVMGTNLALNIAEHGFSVAGYDKWPEPVDKFEARIKAEGKSNLTAFRDMAEFVKSLTRPRRLIMLVKAGHVVDLAIGNLLPLLEPGDTLIDAGNEFYKNTERRVGEL